jgi:hypothetical protein
MFTEHFLEKILEPSMTRDVVIVLICRDNVDGRWNPLHSSLERMSSKTGLMPFCGRSNGRNICLCPHWIYKTENFNTDTSTPQVVALLYIFTHLDWQLKISVYFKSQLLVFTPQDGCFCSSHDDTKIWLNREFCLQEVSIVTVLDFLRYDWGFPVCLKQNMLIFVNPLCERR